MSRRTGRGFALAVLIIASVALVGMMAVSGFGGMPWGAPWGPGTPMMGGPMMGGPMMGGPMMGGLAVPGQGQVTSMAEARSAAERVADQWGLRVREIMRFDNGYYVQLNSPDGSAATELLIDPSTGAVQVEWGPAMMWNTEFGMSRGSSGTAAVSPEQAMTLANQWLASNRPGQTAEDPVEFPGYYTLHTVRDGQVTGMLSVNSTTGAVWYHTWHGRFLGEEEVPSAT